MGAEAALIRAVQLTKDGKAREAAVILDEESKQHQEKKLEIKLAAVQLLLAEVITRQIRYCVVQQSEVTAISVLC
jgi:hypothetical protein